MKIGIIGSGNIGGTAARLFAKAGHDVAVSNSRGPESLKSLVASIGGKARAATVEEAVKFGDVVLLALPWQDRHELPPAELFAGKIVARTCPSRSAIRSSWRATTRRPRRRSRG